MTIEVTKLDIYNEMDIVLSHRRAMQIAKFAGISLSEQTRFATAVSEICRNVLEYVGKGNIVFNVSQNGGQKVQAEIVDEGKGITSIDKVLSRDPMQYKGRGLGIVFARRLCDNFSIATSSKGTRVILEKNFPKKEFMVSKLVVEGWRKHILSEPSLSAYEELKIRNLQLLELTDELKAQKEKLDEQYLKIESLNERLKQNNSNMKDFTYAVSHDLRTPLTSLLLSLSLVDQNDLPAPIKPNFEIANRSVRRLDSTIKGLMDILEIQNPAKHVVREIDLGEVVKNVLEDFSPSLIGDDASVELDFSDNAPLVYVEAFAQSILTNLVSNSIKYRRPEKLNIQISTKKLASGVRLIYADNGKGIDLGKNIKQIFSPFTRFNTDVEGKGVGLYIVKTMLENSGGSIRMNSEVGKGTEFILDFVNYRAD